MESADPKTNLKTNPRLADFLTRPARHEYCITPSSTLP